ncbi:MAG TPA: 1-deoxy-D-xylulose-5-phosphate reductoisomerase [Bacteroidales bacterium]|nr:1-deoxy-D-xylulose-5-phosphate reductoisomerase [Bacteroidales bacterium]
MTPKKIAILGSTGSIGQQALEVVSHHPDKFSIEVLTAQNNVDLLIRQALQFNPGTVIIGNEIHYEKLKKALFTQDIKVFAGQESINSIVESTEINFVLTAIVGFAGLIPTLNAIRSKKIIGLANKETLVVAGEIIMRESQENNIPIIPVDSEHSAIFQCLTGEFANEIKKIILTASGGPFHGESFENLKTKTKADALRHPNWKMGNKITIDSASMVNKGLEIIEAHWLFNVPAEKIDIVIHPQSIIHSMVQFNDGSIKAQMGLPDMRVPIQYALSFPQRFSNNFPTLDFNNLIRLSFEKPDEKIFRSIPIAYAALKKSGNMPCIFNAANEIAVASFLNNEIYFTDIFDILEQTIEKVSYFRQPKFEDLLASDFEARQQAKQIIKKLKFKNS